MKRILLTLVLVASFFAANAQIKAPTGEIIELDKAKFLELVYNFEKNPQEWVYEGKLPCIVDFYADWCGPCKALSPRLAKLAKEYAGKIVIYKINVDKEQQLSRSFGISSIPALLWCPASGEPGFTQGALPEEQLKNRINTFLLK